ncbi:hypothetical protein BT93_L5188 [Corymbia citriodora subsp. variegata]|uniref:Peroxisomal membrane protein PMP47B n=1 Tax=Corymbia citriodora subsp. variegata TaxID=360336 RepID=A0A8T0CJH3_CORYI|nr:hypothetical protein BT93_L5188 [Corymbia citriodora subsp. variegata]
MSDPKSIAPAPTEGDLDKNSPVDAMNQIRETAPTATEADISSSSSGSSGSSGPVNVIPSRDATSTTTAAQQGDNIAHALAGAGGGLLAMTLTYPLITLSTRAQVESKRADTSTIAAIKNIVDREGISGLYSGLDSALFGISVTNFVYYYWYEWTRSFFERAAQKSGRASKKLTTIESMIAGAIAGSATVMTTNPIWVVNTRMTARREEKDIEGQKSPAKKPSTIGTLLSLIKDEGFMSLFAGVLPALVLVINPILQYTFFEQMKNLVEKRRKVGPKDAFYLGALGKLLATSITYPYITVKSRAHVAKKGEPSKGIAPKVSQSVLTAAFLFAFKDVLYDYTVAARRKVATNLYWPTAEHVQTADGMTKTHMIKE